MISPPDLAKYIDTTPADTLESILRISSRLFENAPTGRKILKIVVDLANPIASGEETTIGTVEVIPWPTAMY